jgi:D-tyrosyl-tRNA(Tyr) deacylase
MRAVVQRAKQASVTVGEETVGSIGKGLVILFCVEDGDSDADADFFARKIARMRIFEDGEGRRNLSLLDVGAAALVVSQFTLATVWRKGNRPSLSGAASPEAGRRLYDRFCRQLSQEGAAVETGRFGARMEVALINDGPVTIWMNSRET